VFDLRVISVTSLSIHRAIRLTVLLAHSIASCRCSFVALPLR
jgi:hypothetical protein